MPQEDFGYQTFISQYINSEIQTGKRTQMWSISENIQSFSGHSFFSLTIRQNGHWYEYLRQETDHQYFIFLSGDKPAQVACLKTV